MLDQRMVEIGESCKLRNGGGASFCFQLKTNNILLSLSVLGIKTEKM